MKQYVSAVRAAGGKTTVTVTLVEGTNSAKAQAVTYVDKVDQAIKEARKTALRIMDKIETGLEGAA